MNAQSTDIVCALRDQIAARVGPQRFKIWFRNATRFVRTADVLEVCVPNQFIGRWIERHYADAIRAAATETYGAPPSQLIFTIDTQLGRKLRKTQLNSQAAHVSRSNGAAPTATGRPADGIATDSSRRLRGRLEHFVVGACNRMAHSAALDIIERRPGAASPLFIHGGCGLGKTHLLHAVANACATGPHASGPMRCLYASAEEFTNQFIGLIRGDGRTGLNSFRQRFRDVDVLLLDDVHFLANKKSTQEEFLHTFNSIDMVGRQVVLASDAHPGMIGQMSAALVNRFVSGMVVRIDPPDLPTRCAILKRLAQTRGMADQGRQIPGAVIEYIADRIRSNVRELEGALTRIVATAAMAQEPITLLVARRVLEDHAAHSEPALTAEQIESVVATFFGLTTAELHTSRKPQTIALARSIAMYLARKHTPLSFPELGRLMGNKNHSTVLLACRRVEAKRMAGERVCWRTPSGSRTIDLEALIGQLEAQLPGLGRGGATRAID